MKKIFGLDTLVVIKLNIRSVNVIKFDDENYEEELELIIYEEGLFSS